MRSFTSKFIWHHGRRVSHLDLPYSPIAPQSLITRRYDLALSHAFQDTKGTQILSRHVQRALCARWNGYLPPGSCLITELPNGDTERGGGNQFGASSIAVLPTMRYPVDVRWHQDLVYNAVWSLLVEIGQWNAEHLAPRPGDDAHKIIKRVLMTGVGTGYGKVSAARCAQQMILAIRHFAQGVPDEAVWDNVSNLIQEVNVTRGL